MDKTRIICFPWDRINAINPGMTGLLFTLSVILSLSAGPNALGSSFPLASNAKVQAHLDHFTETMAGRKKIAAAVARMKKHAPVLDAAFDKHDMPKELLAIPIIESEYRNLPQTKKQIYGAGIWMFTKATARRLGLKITPKRDDRLNIALATDAAIRLLKIHHEEFGDWELAILAYNAGEGTVRRGLKETGSRDAWQLVAAGHSNDPEYLAKVIAAATVLRSQSVKSLP